MSFIPFRHKDDSKQRALPFRSSGYGRVLPFRGATDEFKESEHPRGQPGNKGQFGPGGGSGNSYKGHFAKGSKQIATHYTSPETAEKLVNGAIEKPSSGTRTWQGSALYLFPGDRENDNFGSTKLHAYPEFEHPFVGTTNDIEKKVDELKKNIEPPIMRHKNGDPIIASNGEPFRMWFSDNDKNDALREAWMTEGYDGIIETDSHGTPTVLAVFDLSDIKIEHAKRSATDEYS